MKKIFRKCWREGKNFKNKVFVTVQSQAKFHKTGVIMLAFLRLFLKFYLADTPRRAEMRSILEVGSEQLHVFMTISMSHCYECVDFSTKY